jgi:hypothetical protein
MHGPLNVKYNFSYKGFLLAVKIIKSISDSISYSTLKGHRISMSRIRIKVARQEAVSLVS